MPELPGIGGGNRPSPPDRPGIGGGNRPSLPERPGIGGGNRPTLPERPTLPDRPGIGGGNRPNLPDRPGIGDGNRPNLPDRPIVGRPRPPGGPIRPDRPILGDNNVININRPGWGWSPGWGWNPRWGWNAGWGWHPWQPWYHGAWNWHRGNNWWFRPPAFFVGWGLGNWASSGQFSNPYFVAASGPFDYSQPIVINNIVTAEESAGLDGPMSPAPENQEAIQLFDDGMAAFKSGQYQESLDRFDKALKILPGDPVLHEMRALALFSLGKFQAAAAVLNSFLAVAPGMDWTTLSGLYDNLEDYTEQLRALESHVEQQPADAAATFVLAYHYLAMGHNENALELLRRVVELEPSDVTAKRLLNALEGPASLPPAQATAEGKPPPETDLVGRWRALAGEATIDLEVNENSQFTWKAAPRGQPRVELQGNLSTQDDFLVLETDSQGSMIGQVKSGGPDSFKFLVAGAPPGDAGLSFARQP